MMLIPLLLVLLALIGVAACAPRAPLSLTDKIAFGLVLSAAAAAVWTTPSAASGLDISDSVEYVAGALRYLRTGDYLLPLGAGLPPRYPPWFSLFFLSPVYRFADAGLGSGVCLEFFFCLLGALGSAMLGHRLSGTWGAVAAGLIFTALPGLRYFGAHVLTDVPLAVLFLWGQVLYVNARTEELAGVRHAACAAILAAAAAALKATGAALLIPLILMAGFSGRSGNGRRSLQVIITALPTLALVLAGMVYDQAAFGGLMRSGYHYWMSVPYDYFGLTFAPRYVAANVQVLLSDSGIPVLALVVGLWPAINKRATEIGAACVSAAPLKRMLEYLVLAGAPLLVFHLFYFYQSPRFFLPLAAMLAPAAGGVLGAVFVTARWHPRRAVIACAAVCAVIVAMRLLSAAPTSPRRVAAERLRRCSAAEATVITGLDPVYAALVAPGADVVPVSRRIEFASKVVARRAPEAAPPALGAEWAAYRGFLLAHGGTEAVPEVALEGDAITRRLLSGRAVCLEASLVTSEERAQLEQLYETAALEDGLFRLSLRR